MRVPAHVLADEPLMAALAGDAALEQLVNGTMLPGIVGAALAMPDIHQGYGLPVGGVVAIDVERGVVSPGAIGFDINCGVRLLATGLERAAVASRLGELINALYAAIPLGVGGAGPVALTSRELDGPLADGARWAVRNGWGEDGDLDRIEAEGRLGEADPGAVSARARERGRRQLGTLGSGNHFVEVQAVDTIYDREAAAGLGLEPETVTLMIHTGSRGLGHQVCTDHAGAVERSLERYGIAVPDRQLACAPLGSPEADAYLGAMRSAANFAFANRQLLCQQARDAVRGVFGFGAGRLPLPVVWDIAHNIAREETHQVEGRPRRLLVHRKGATRAFPGQPVLVPGDMGRASYVLVGTERALEETFGSACHGAGRVLSRTAARGQARGRDLVAELARMGVVARAAGRDALAEEMPEAYKDVAHVVDVCHASGIARRVARLKPLGVVKG